MEKSHEYTNSEGVCNKIYHAIGANCGSRKSNRSDSIPEKEVVTEETVKIHIESVPKATNQGKLQPDRIEINGRQANPNPNLDMVPNRPISSAHEHKHREGNHENLYADYITRMKGKMGISTKIGVGGEKNTVKAASTLASTARRDSFNEKIVHFINRGKKKIRGPSNFVEE